MTIGLKMVAVGCLGFYTQLVIHFEQKCKPKVRPIFRENRGSRSKYQYTIVCDHIRHSGSSNLFHWNDAHQILESIDNNQRIDVSLWRCD